MAVYRSIPIYLAVSPFVSSSIFNISYSNLCKLCVYVACIDNEELIVDESKLMFCDPCECMMIIAHTSAKRHLCT